MFKSNNAYVSDGSVLYAEQVGENKVFTIKKGCNVYKKTVSGNGYNTGSEELIGFSSHTIATTDGIYVFKEDEIIEKSVLDKK